MLVIQYRCINKIDLYTSEHETPDELFKDNKSFDLMQKKSDKLLRMI